MIKNALKTLHRVYNIRCMAGRVRTRVKWSVKAEPRFLEKVNKGLGIRRKGDLVWENLERIIEFQGTGHPGKES